MNHVDRDREHSVRMVPRVIARRKGQHFRLLASGAVSLFFVARALINRMNGDRSAIAILLLLFIGTVMLLLIVSALRMLLDRRPALVIDPTGVHDFISSARPGLLPWANIHAAEIKRLSGADVIVLKLRDDQPIREAVSGTRKVLVEHSVKQVGSPIALPVKFMDADRDEILLTIKSGISGTD